MLIARFYREKIEDRDATIVSGQLTWRDEERCDILIPGDREERVVKIITPDLLRQWEFGTLGNNADAGHQKLLAQYKRWKENEDEPVEGTPLEMCGFLSPANIENLKSPPRFIRTVEQLAAFSDAQGQGIPFFMDLRRKAQTFIEAQTGPAALAARQDEQNKTITAQAVQIQALTRQIAELAASRNVMPLPVSDDRTGPTGTGVAIEDDDDPTEGARQSGAIPATKVTRATAAARRRAMAEAEA